MKNLILILVIFIVSCSNSLEQQIQKALLKASESPTKSLKTLDVLLSEQNDNQSRVKVLSAIEEITKVNLKNPDLLKQALIKKKSYSQNVKEKNEIILTLSQLSIQNLKNEVEALNFLDEIDLKTLNSKQREQYFQLIVSSHLKTKNRKQALIETNDFLKSKSLTPSERYKLSILKSRILTLNEKHADAQKIYLDLIKNYPNLSKKWKLRSQLALSYEDQKKYKKALGQLKKEYSEGEEKDQLLKLRIDELSKRLLKQPGAKGRLKR